MRNDENVTVNFGIKINGPRLLCTKFTKGPIGLWAGFELSTMVCLPGLPAELPNLHWEQSTESSLIHNAYTQ